MRRLIAPVGLVFLLLLAISSPAASAEKVRLIKVDGVVNPVMSEFIIANIDRAEKDGASAVVIQLDTPGGLDLSMRDIVKEILSSEVPVVVFVGPSGSRAASAGVFIAYAAHVAAMAPGTNIGSAHPVAMGGGKMDETMSEKVENDAVAYIKSIASKRKRNMEWAEMAVRESVNVTAEEALNLVIIDAVADDVNTLLRQIDGKQVDTPVGIKTLRTAGAEIETVEMGLRHRILKTITDPNVAYILMMVAMLGLYFEISNPGAIFPGVVGAVSLVLAFYAFQTLPVNYAGLLLIGLAVIFFIAEIQITSFGLLAIGGIISLTLGSLMLYDSPVPYLRVSLWVLVPTIIIASAFSVAVIYLAMNVHKKRKVSGEEGIVGMCGNAVTDIGPEGTVFVNGEYWSAVSDWPLKEGQKIKVLEVNGMRLKVTGSLNS
jgi:membrane-bound serine protease (ClpP class)